MAEPEKEHHFLIAKDGLHSDSESGDYDVDEIAREVAQRRETVSRYRQSTEESQLIGRQSKNTRNHVNRVYASLLTTRSFSCIICFVSLLALALLVASTIILCIRPYPWRKELISMVFVVMSSAAIVIFASCFYSMIHLLLIPCTNNIPFTFAAIVVDFMLPIYLFQVGFGIRKDEKGRWSYQGRDWCANPHHGGCSRLVYVLSILNGTAGYIAIFIGFVHIGLLITRFITLLRSRFFSKANPHLSVFPNAEKFKISSVV